MDCSQQGWLQHCCTYSSSGCQGTVIGEWNPFWLHATYRWTHLGLYYQLPWYWPCHCHTLHVHEPSRCMILHTVDSKPCQVHLPVSSSTAKSLDVVYWRSEPRLDLPVGNLVDHPLGLVEHEEECFVPDIVLIRLLDMLILPIQLQLTSSTYVLWEDSWALLVDSLWLCAQNGSH